MVITMAKLRMAHASTHGARKPPGPKEEEEEERLNDGDNNGQATHGARKHAWRMQASWAKISRKSPQEKSSGNIFSKNLRDFSLGIVFGNFLQEFFLVQVLITGLKFK